MDILPMESHGLETRATMNRVRISLVTDASWKKQPLRKLTHGRFEKTNLGRG